MSRKKKHVDYYQVLGVSRDATDEDIKKGYRKQALRWHPDKNHGDVENAAEQFKIVSEAYQVLSDRRRRQIYDLKGCNVGEAGAFTEEDAAAAAAAFDLNAFSSPADIYRQFFPEDAGFADLLDSLDYGKRKTRKHDVNDFNAGDAGAFAYGGTAAGAYDFDTFLSPADLYRKFFPEDKGFADFLDSFGQNGPQQAGDNRPMNDTASRGSDRQQPAGNDPSRDSKSSERDRQEKPGNDQSRKDSSSSDRDRSQQAEAHGTKKSSDKISERDGQHQPGNDQPITTEITAEGPASNKGVPESNAGAQHPEQRAEQKSFTERASEKWNSFCRFFSTSPQVVVSEANVTPAKYIEWVQVLLSQRGEVYQKYEVAINKFRANKDFSALDSQLKKIDANHKQLTQKIADIQTILKPQAPQAAGMLAELQTLDTHFKGYLQNAVLLARKFVGGSVEKQQYLIQQNELGSKKKELFDKIDSVMASLCSL